MGALRYFNAAVSTALRAITYLYLRVAPHHLAVPVIPVLYSLYLLTYSLSAIPLEESTKIEPANGNEEKAKDERPEVRAVKVTSPQSPDTLSTILFSLPTPIAKLRITNLALNTLLFLAAVDFTAYPYFDAAQDVTFTRVGAVYPDAVKLAVRYPYPYDHNVTESILQVQYRQVKQDSVMHVARWQDGPLVPLSAEDDWTNTVKLADLSPSTSYEYRLRCNAPCEPDILPYPASPIRFRTFPDPRLTYGSHFRFVFTSCTTLNFPYLPFQGRTIKGYDLLADYIWPRKPVLNLTEAAGKAKSVLSESLETAKLVVANASEAFVGTTSSSEPAISTAISVVSSLVSPSPSPSASPSLSEATDSPEGVPVEFMLFLGDFIYADVPVYFGDSEEAYRRLYRRTYNSPSFRKVYEKLQAISAIFHVYDDHEIINNFAGQGSDSIDPYPTAARAYETYLAAANYESAGNDKYYYDFRYGDVAFFVMDTRRYRSDINSEDVESRTMLGDQQLAALYDWLGKVNSTATFKFIVTSVPFTSLWTYEGQIDTWAAFEHEKASLLDVLHTVPNVIFLSGDRHEFAVIEFTAEHGYPILEVSTSPLNMFYVPFIRTLKPRSEAVVRKIRTEVIVTEEGLNDTVTVVDEVPKERVIKSALEVDTTNANKPVVHLELLVDGKSTYK
ncbi:hypothetical protein GLOTRDRAFT_91906 [Gloeophyllum trabeum ATCC 11539]|uniref:PhoD-like phosphatase metallophosphatase domain-containing protein n=1 Tax=Gloeophyllum trabeum (strain ATCC 11539 / FP-39264 / Madison 617) TaxID=670483 RepID=S7RUV6_GLOTA|nr:uncharacterized protein GLOTRDRAFT_91906 [Gloeophyllum trabeum ATCC 11539]EPQ58515.1 hypothetical protein GLOTRDRAFT_91906 [Gloeophyllum trabeum ATCC 11539]